MNNLKAIVSRLERPDGSKEYPVRTCRDLHAFYPEKPSGNYWVDPNKGCKSDAIEVRCDFSDIDRARTCINATEMVGKNNWHKQMPSEGGRKWFTEEHKLGKLEYAADKSQLTYLGYLHAGAVQNVTVHCKNFVAWKNAERNNHKHAMEFMGAKRQEFSHWGEKKPEVLLDECQNIDLTKPTWKRTMFKFTTHKFVRLPILDFKPHHIADRSAQFGIELGPICYY